MKLQVTLPENISEITLRQFTKYEQLNEKTMDSLNYMKRKISIFTDIPFRDIGNIRSNHATKILNQIDKALSTEAKFEPTFTMHDIEFGFIPNLDKITFDEHRMMVEYGVNKDTMHKLMAILFRPVINREGDKYDIMPFDDSEPYAEMMKDMPIHIVDGALVFFWNLASELQQATQKYMSEELLKEMKPQATSRISGGIRHIKNWLTTMFSKSRPLAS